MNASKPNALLLDEMLSPAIAAELASRGVDCRAVAADPLLRALSDLEIFDVGLLENRIVVTNNVADFESLRRARDAAGGPVPGLIYTSDAAFPRTKAYVSRLAAALEIVAASHETASRGGVLWLRPPRPLRCVEARHDDRGQSGQVGVVDRSAGQQQAHQ